MSDEKNFQGRQSDSPTEKSQNKDRITDDRLELTDAQTAFVDENQPADSSQLADTQPITVPSSHDTPSGASPSNTGKLSAEQVSAIQMRMSRGSAASDHDMEKVLHTYDQGSTPRSAMQAVTESDSPVQRPTAPRPVTPKQFKGPNPHPVAREASSHNIPTPPPVSPALTAKNTGIHGPVRGIAEYHGKTIKLSAPENFSDGAELIVCDHHYELRKGKGGPGALTFIMVAIVLFVAGVFAGPHLMGIDTETGSIAGVALDTDGQPFGIGGVIRIPELGISTSTDESGLFVLQNVPSGEYDIECNLSQHSRGTARVNVVSASVTGITLRSQLVEIESEQPATQASISHSSENNSSQNTKNDRPTAVTSDSRSSASTSNQSTRGALAVTSDVSGAVVYIDGQRLGEVNNTFRKMNTGDRTLVVKRDGFESYSGEVTIEADKIAKIHVTLTPIKRAKNEPEPSPTSPQDIYKHAKDLADRGESLLALAELNKALTVDPGLADAHFLRAELAGADGDVDAARTDYIQAGEIYTSQKRYGDAEIAFDLAVGLSGDKSPALKARGDYFTQRRKYDPALEDYKKALDINSDNYAARFALGKAYLEAGKSRSAYDELRRAHDLRKDDPNLYHYLMLASLAKNDIGDVNRYYNEFKTIASDREISRFKSDQRFSAIVRLVGE